MVDVAGALEVADADGVDEEVGADVEVSVDEVVGVTTAELEVVVPVGSRMQEHAELTCEGFPAQFSRYVGIAVGSVLTVVV